MSFFYYVTTYTTPIAYGVFHSAPHLYQSNCHIVIWYDTTGPN